MRRRVLLGCLIWALLVLSCISQAKVFRLEFFPSNSPLDDYGAKRVVPHPRLGLALSGGGARGFAHIGVLKVLERENIPISAIAGTSMGGAIGGLFAAGYSAAELENLALSINWQDIFSDTPPRLSLLQPQREEAEGALFQIRFKGLKPQIPSGLTSAQKLTNLFSGLTFQADYFSGLDFDRLRIPFRSVTTDLITGQKVVLDSGELAMALRATIAVPLAITPLSYDGMLLVDGGLVDPVPVEVVRILGADLVIAVNTSATLLPEEKIQDPLDIASQAVSIMSLEQKIQSLASADLVLEPISSGFSSTDFAEAESLILLGEKAADSLLPEIRRRLEQDSTPRSEIGEIQFEGNMIIPDDSLISWSGLRVKGIISEKEIYGCLSRIYHSGYFRDVEAELDTAARPANLTIRVEENPAVEEIMVQIKSEGPNLTGRTFHYFPESRVLKYQELEQIVDKRVSELRQQGSSLTRLESIEYQPESARLTAVIDQGKIVKLNLSGNRQTKNWMVYSNFPLKAGKVFNQNLAQRGIANLQSSGYFDQVRLTARNSPAGVSLHLSLSERNFSLLRGGAHWWDEYHLEGFLESGYLNLLGTGNQIFLKALYGERRANYSISLKANRIFKTYLTYNLSLYYRTEENFLYDRHADIGGFKEIRRGGKFSLGHNLARLGKVSAEFQAERISLYNSLLNQSQGENKRSILFKLLFDNLDRYPYPNKGNYNQLQVELASRILKGDVSYRKFYITLETYLPLTDKFNLHPVAEIGYSDRKLPFYEKFSLGDKESFYGFFSEERRGNKLGVARVELRVKTARRIFWFLRYDIGDAWEDKVEFRKPRHAVGLKLGITTPLGPMELAYGYSSLHFKKVYLTWGYQF